MQTLDAEQLQRRLAPIGATGVRTLAGGASSLTYAATLGGQAGEPVVIKVAPPGVPPVLNRDVLRQARMIKALGPTAVPVPEVIWEDAGAPPEVPPLFVMRFVPGTSCEPLFDRDGDMAEDAVRPAFLNAAATLASLHSLDPVQLGFGAEPRVGPAEEIDRWCRLLETVDQAPVAGWPAVADQLRAAEPSASPRPAVVHGDFRLGNLLASEGTIRAVVDWEIWSVGDPRVDLGWFLVNADPASYHRDTRYAARVPSLDELTGVYSARYEGEPSDLAWFRALACFKSAATWSLIVKHNRRRPTPDPDLEAMAGTLPDLLHQASRLV